MACKKILILGVTGMLGHSLFFYLSSRKEFKIYGTSRNLNGLKKCFPAKYKSQILNNIDVDSFDSLIRGMAEIKPDIVINCIGIIKQMAQAKDPIISISVNSLFPHKLAYLCKATGSRLVHISSDCVFDGLKGNYLETDIPNATDLYGMTKYLGEVTYPHCVTLRTSIIGHELKEKKGLIEWFFQQKGEIQGYSKAIYSGFPTIEMGRILADYVLPRSDLQGLYHVSSVPISKYDLLSKVARIYRKKIIINKNESLMIDRSMNSTRFQKETGYYPPSWEKMLDSMYKQYKSLPCYNL